MRAFERTVRRARIPVAYSGGYHPHPKISFATALGVGMTSEAEYLDMELNTADLGDLSTQHVFERLRSAVPPGMPVIAVCAAEGKPALASRIEWASYCVSVHASIRPELEDAVLEFLSSDSAIAEVNTKSGRRRAEIRPRCASFAGQAVAPWNVPACGARGPTSARRTSWSHLDAMRGRTARALSRHEFTAILYPQDGPIFPDREGGDLVSR